MDDDEEEREFSRSIVFGFFTQAEETFVGMDIDMYVTGLTAVMTNALTVIRKNKDLAGLSSKGHFLKGSSATLGFTKIRDECEKIQNYGRKKDETGTNDEPDEEKLLRLIEEAVNEVKRAYKVVEALMKKFYNDV
jgi:osomolarity two-component system, phosphorelay intermediate protein YPD1